MKQKHGYWKNTISRALKTGYFSKTAKNFAALWNHCAIGEKHDFHGLSKYGPADDVLEGLGMAFYHFVEQDEPQKADLVLDTIQLIDPSKPELMLAVMQLTEVTVLKNEDYSMTYAVKEAQKRYEAYKANKKASAKANAGNKARA